nr:hypothetical protein [Amycolatopsis nigrescens]
MEEVTVTGGAGVVEVPGGQPPQRPDLAPALRIALATGQLRRPLSETLRPLLSMLVDGRYKVTGPGRIAEEWADPVPTDNWPPDDEDRVTYYRTAISTGHRPVAVLLNDGPERRGFILDGHHKIAAYQAENMLPWVIRIAKITEDAQPAVN